MMHVFPATTTVHCIEIKGAGARRFAQAQFAGDVDALVPGHWQWNAWLTSHGRVRAVMHLADAGDGRLFAVLRGGDAEAIHAGLARYLLRIPATVALRTFAGVAGSALAAGEVHIDGDGLVLGYGSRRLELTPGPVEPDPAACLAWHRDDIARGWPILPPGEPEFLPPALGLEHLGAVAFGKGCYPGQEIAARLHYRGGHKYRLHHLQGTAIPPTDPIRLPDGATCRILHSATDRNVTDALVVGPVDMPIEINILHDNYHVISIFDA